MPNWNSLSHDQMGGGSFKLLESTLVGTIIQAYRLPILHASCGVFGERKIRAILKIVRIQFQN